jgi:hypothetical protein
MASDSKRLRGERKKKRGGKNEERMGARAREKQKHARLDAATHFLIQTLVFVPVEDFFLSLLAFLIQFVGS